MIATLNMDKVEKLGAHEYRIASAKDVDALLGVVAAEYVRLRAECILPLSAVQLDGIEVMDVKGLAKRLRQAVIPRPSSSPGTSFDILRSDFGETLGYLLLEHEYRTSIGYKGIRDRETIELPGRGIDAVGTEAGKPLALVLGEVKLSEEAKSPPQVVDKSEDGLRKQHRGHLADRQHTANKLFNISRFVRDAAMQTTLQAAALLFENGNPLEIVSASLLIRTNGCHHEKDFGTFKKRPTDYKPANIRFWIFSIPLTAEDLVKKWTKHVEAAKGAA